MKAFISHSTRDMTIVEEFRKSIESLGIQAYLAVYDIQPGKDLWKKIETNIKNSHVLIAILTQEGAKSEIVNQEMAIAKANKILVVPIVEEGNDPKGLLRALEYIILDKNHLDKTKAQILAHLGTLSKEKSNKEAVILFAVLVMLVFLLASSSK